jgi:hypothetical protein
MAEKSKKKGAASFCIPRAAIEALINAQASAVEICAYLVLARFTDPSGMYTSSSVNAVSNYASINKKTIAKAIARLTTINATVTRQVPAKSKGKFEVETVTLGPILHTREQWLAAHPDQVLPDGPISHSKVRYVLPDFPESEGEPVWFGANLVSGFGTFTQPLRSVRDAGSVAARLLLSLYMLHDLDQWGGIDPIIGPRRQYTVADEVTKFGCRIIRAEQGPQYAGGTWAWVMANATEGDSKPYFAALAALEAAGLVYEMVVVLNRAPVIKHYTDKDGKDTEYQTAAIDAELLYELDCRSSHGYANAGEEGLARVTARTAADFKRPVTDAGYWREYPEDGLSGDPAYVSDRPDGKVGGNPKATFSGVYAAIVNQGQEAMVIGVYRLRFRPANPKNAGVKDAWAKIHTGNRRALELINAVRNRAGLPALPAPGDVAAKARAAAAEMAPHAPPNISAWNDPTIPF